jgi:transposase
MSANNNGQYSREFKLEAVRQSIESGKFISAVARELGITRSRLYKWRKEFKSKGLAESFPGTGHSTPDRDLENLQKENKELRMELDILKKSIKLVEKYEAEDSE